MSLDVITVVIPTFNRAGIISRAIESVINQTYKNWELLIVDDGSTDKTKELIQRKYLGDSRIRLIERPEFRPKGANSCRNIGLENATGKYIAMLDSDDEWKKKHLDKCYQFAESTNGFTGSYSSAFIKRGPFKVKRRSRVINKDESFFDFLLSNGSAMTPTIFLRRNLAKRIKYDESLQRHQDWDFFIRFGKEYSWQFNPSMEVIVHRKIKNNFENHDYESFAKFYERYKNLITKKEVRIKYLSSYYEKALIKNDEFGKDYFGNKLNSLRKENNIGSYDNWFSYYKLKIQQTYLFLYLKYMAKSVFTLFKY